MLARFTIRQLLCFTVIFAVMLGVGFSTDAIYRDGVWEIESISKTEAGTWSGVTEDGDDIGGIFFEYNAVIRDGDRTRSIYIGNELQHEIPEVGAKYRLTNTVVKDSNIADFQFYDLDDRRVLLPTIIDNKTMLVINLTITAAVSFLLTVVVSVLFRVFYHVVKIRNGKVDEGATADASEE